VLARGVNNVSPNSQSANVENEPELESGMVSDGGGGLSDHDEINGKERLAAVNSPIKAGKRLNSDVRMLLVVAMVTHPSSPIQHVVSQTKVEGDDAKKRNLKKLRPKISLASSQRNGSGIPLSRRISLLWVRRWILGAFPKERESR
jgi:hypothetical protein